MESDSYIVFSQKSVFGPQKHCFSGCFWENEAVLGKNTTFLGKSVLFLGE